MKYYILDREEAKKGNIVIYDMLRTEPQSVDIDKFVYITEEGKNIPNNWCYEETEDTIIDYGNIPKDKIENKEVFLREKQKEKRDNLISSNLEYKGNMFQVRDKDIANFEDAYSLMTDTDIIEWITANNNLINLTKEDINNILTQYKLRKNSIFKEYINKVIKTRG